MKILVTGGAGFIGSHVADALSAAGHQVTIFDVRDSPYRQPEQKVVIGSIMDQEVLHDLVQNTDVVYHFAGIADIDECAGRPVDTAQINIVGTIKLLEACRHAAVQRFVFASSAYVFSNSGYFYRTSKQACESFIENFQQMYGLPYTCLRYGSLYGERADSRNSIYRLLKEAVETGTIIYRGTGEEQREFIHVKDAAESSVAVLDKKYENTFITLTGNEKMRYRDLLDMINEILGNTVKIEVEPSTRKAHYKITPYNFSPKLGLKMVNNPHVDMGQGLLLALSEIYENMNSEHIESLGLLVPDA